MLVRRLKSHSSETGTVYQYYFVGKRPALPDEAYSPATEFVFDVSFGGNPTFAISVFLPTHAVELWQRKHGRELVDTEQYAAAKMRLFRGFDEIENMRENGRRLLIAGEDLDELLDLLGVD